MEKYFLEPPSYERTLRQCNLIKLQNREVKLFSIGKSFLGRKIYALALGNTKNAVLFAGAFHAQEWL
ncbi:MAG: gamma-D-glutamyl-meso-diaminopimelate peptidase, partial [Oscillospiraceae bacterium]|nr:gamma-D-glutamyl-meso-diaminopimelate peptidase [Oscillospiraceae bacterium]